MVNCKKHLYFGPVFLHKKFFDILPTVKTKKNVFFGLF